MTLKNVPKFVQTTTPIEDKLTCIVQECVQLRKQSKISVVELSKWIQVDRRRIADFEKGKFDIYLAEKILGYYGKTLTFKTCLY